MLLGYNTNGWAYHDPWVAIELLAEIGYTGGVYVELSRHSHEAPVAAQRAYRFLQPLIESVGRRK